MYKVASDRRQASLHRGRPSDWVNGQERLSDADKIKQFQEGINILEARILALPRGEERTRLGREKNALQTDLSELRKQVKRETPLEWKLFFVDEAKRLLSQSQFEMVYNAALRECRLCAQRTGRGTDCENDDHSARSAIERSEIGEAT